MDRQLIDDKTTAVEGRVVYLLGVMPRSGTNFLNDLMCRHPDIGTTVHLPEDFLIANSDHLVQYAEAVYRSWDTLWGEFDPALTEPLLKALGAGLESFLYAQTDTEWLSTYISEDDIANAAKENLVPRIKVNPPIRLARTPAVENLQNVARLSDSKAVIIVRDGRAVLESGMRSFGWFFEDAIQRWSRAAQLIHDVAKNNDQMHVVRYEDILDDREGVMRSIFEFLEIDPDLYDYAAEVAVRGSSTFFDDKKGMNWGETKMTKDFDPRKRWDHWRRSRHARTNWVAADQLRLFGYEPVDASGPVWSVYNMLYDAVWPLRHWMRNNARKLLPKRMRDAILWARGQRYRGRLKK